MIKVSDDIILYSLSRKYASDIFKTLDGEREYIRVWLPFEDSTYKIGDIEKPIDCW